MSKFKGVAVAILALLISAFGKNEKIRAEDEQQPSNLHYRLAAKGGRITFYLGEAIELEESYSADVAKKYLLRSMPEQMKGHATQIAMEPGQDIIDRAQDDGKRSVDSILHANCSVGSGHGIGSACSLGERWWQLTSSSVRLQLDLTRHFQINQPGHYSMQAKTANVVIADNDI